MSAKAIKNGESGLGSGVLGAGGWCDCGNAGVKKLHGKEWISDRCIRIEIAWNKRKPKSSVRLETNRGTT